MALLATPEDLTRFLAEAKGVVLKRLTRLTPNRMLIYADWRGHEIAFTADVIEVLSKDLPEEQLSDGQSSSKRSRKDYKSKILSVRSNLDPTKLSTAELDRRGLPLYYNEQWLKARYEELGSYAEISRIYGYGETVLSQWGLKFGIEGRPSYDPKWKEERIDEITQMLKEGTAPSQAALAKQWGVSKPTVTRMFQRARQKLESETSGV